MAYTSGNAQYNGLEVAVIGMAGRFPGAHTIQELWNILINNQDKISTFSPDEIRDPFYGGSVVRDLDYVRARGILSDIEYFDAALFGYTPQEARLLDPQVRLFHECSWEALEDAGYNPFTFPELIGVFAGAHTNVLWEMKGILEEQDMDYGNKDFMASRLSYRLNLRGPSQNIYTACSTSLVAVHLACRSILSGECTIAIAGGASIELPQERGYLYKQGGILSSSGHNKSFSKESDGTVFSNGVGVVILKLLEEAVKDNDNIYAVVKGSAINNDGNRKVSFTAPSVKGQVEVIKDAIAFSGLIPEDICYVESHGSATAVGDPIEVEALKQAFDSSKKQFCGIGSIKSNIGHTNAAAGICGFIKTVLALKYKIIPASIHFETPNPSLNLENTPFYVVDRNLPLEERNKPLHMGVTSLGVGGTNVHVVLGEGPLWHTEPVKRKFQLLTFSARSEKALQDTLSNFDQFLSKDSTNDLVNIAYSLNTGRVNFAHRAFTVCGTKEELKDNRLNRLPLIPLLEDHTKRKTIFVFPAPAYYFNGLARKLYDQEPGFRHAFDKCLEVLAKISGMNYGRFFQDGTPGNLAPDMLNQAYAFSVQYATASYLIELGIIPDYIVDHEGGALAAACVAGVNSLEETLSVMMHTARRDWQSKVPVQQNPSTCFIRTNQQKTPSYILMPGENHPQGDDMALALLGAIIVNIGSDKNLTNWADTQADKPGNYKINILPISAEEEDEVLYFSKQLGNLWSLGANINWEAYYRSQERRKVSLPTYPFEKKRFWYEADLLTKFEALFSKDVANTPETTGLLYVPMWQQIVLPPKHPMDDKKKSWLILGNDDERTQAIANRLSAANQMVTVVLPGENYFKTSDGYCINVSCKHDYQLLIQTLAEQNLVPDQVIHLWNLTSFGPTCLETFNRAQTYGYYSLVFLCQALAALEERKEVFFSLVTSNLHSLLNRELAEIEKAPLVGLMRVIPQEDWRFNFVNLDFDNQALTHLSRLTDWIVRESSHPSLETVIAYREKKRWVETYQPVLFNDSSELPLFQDGGVYLVLGGLGNLGIHQVHYIARKIKAIFILVSRTGLPEIDQWGSNGLTDSSKGQKFSLLKEVEQNGSRILTEKADVSDRPAMQQIWQSLLYRFGKIDGVVHAAGIIDDASTACPFQNLDRDRSKVQFTAKINGLYILDELFRMYPAPKFCILNSSLSSILGGLGFTAYSAANTFMDYFARSRGAASETKWLSINWDTWNFGLTNQVEVVDHAYRSDYTLSREEALEALSRALTLDCEQVVIAKGDLNRRRSRYIELKKNQLEQQAQDAPIVKAINYETIVVDLWKKHLGLAEIKSTDNFFSVGGDSFLLVSFINDLNRVIGRKILIEEFYKSPNVAALVNLISSKSKGEAAIIKPAEEKEYYALSAPQKRMYYHYALDPDGTNYNETKIFEVDNKIDADRIEQSFRQIIERHEGLRTSFGTVGEETVQYILPQIEFKIDIFNNVPLSITEFCHDFVRPFNLAKAPLFRLAIVHTTAGMKYFVSDFHHIIYDTVSLTILTNELLCLYNNLPITPVKLRYKDVSEYYNSYSYQSKLQSQKYYWINKMRGLGRVGKIPVDYHKIKSERLEEALEELVVGPTDFGPIKELVQGAGVTMFSFLAASLAILISNHGRTDEVVLGVPVSGRTDPGTNEVVGMFVNILPLRVRPHRHKYFRQFLKETNQDNIELINNQHFPFNDLVRELKNEYGYITPLFNVVFNMTSWSERTNTGNDTTFFKHEINYSHNRVSKYNFIVNVTELENGISIIINYSPEQYLASTIKRLLRHFRQIMAAFVNDESIPLQDISLEGLNKSNIDSSMLNEEFDFS